MEEKVITFLGIDVGSTTAKVVISEDGCRIYEKYERHLSQVRQKCLEMLKDAAPYLAGKRLKIAFSGSAGLGLAEALGIPFVQEVYATGETVKRLAPDTTAVVELGGEDAKVIFFEGGTDERMNGTCAGGTGAFIDQMATLLDLTPEEMDSLSLKHERLYPIASRCGVFAKTDIQPLLNQGARKEDLAASIYQAVVNQTIAGLAQGRKIAGKVMFLGGPLYYNYGLRERFVKTLKLSPEEAIFPAYGLYAVAIGAAMYAEGQGAEFGYEELLERLDAVRSVKREASAIPPLFSDQADYDAFLERHNRATVKTTPIEDYSGPAYLGIDCGSTTTKLVLMSESRELLYTYYNSNRGNPVQIVKEQLETIYSLCGDRIKICGSTVTGYGEDLILHAFRLDSGVVETMAHFTAARYFNPDVDFILDIGGQDIKCFRIADGAIDSIMLNEACSSGCGSFIETFARSMGYDTPTFAKLALFAKAPVSLGTRCTVFMNSSVKQAQKDGAPVSDISAGLSISVVKNAIYKVIRATSPEALGKNVVVQGGTFLNDAVLRSFERELGRDVIRPTVAGLMGAYGAALYAQGQSKGVSTILTPAELFEFTHTAQAVTCNKCTNHCQLTVNSFGGGKKYISGNKCERGAGIPEHTVKALKNLHQYKRDLLAALPKKEGKRGKIGLPLALGMYELLPLWNAVFTELGFEVVTSGFSSRELYAKGQYSIPSDTACYPAKLMHGHIETLIGKGVDYIFYPSLTYNVIEGEMDNHYNCPVVAYYSELLKSNMDSLDADRFLYPYLNINDPRILARGLRAALLEKGIRVAAREMRRAVAAGLAAYDAHMQSIRREGELAVAEARKQGKRVMILAGRPYHIDPEIGHGIDKLAASLGFVVVSEDSVAHLGHAGRVGVLNQWTYHARLYNAAAFAAENPDVELVQLVSFGCGIDAITTDAVHGILQRTGKLYTQIKIDEITNLGAVKIRLRSLLGALAEREAKHE